MSKINVYYMTTLTSADIATAILMWVIAICYFTGMIIAYRLRHHIDVNRLTNPDIVRHSIKTIAFPPANILTDRGRRRRNFAIGLWLVGALAFAVLAIWKSISNA